MNQDINRVSFTDTTTTRDRLTYAKQDTLHEQIDRGIRFVCYYAFMSFCMLVFALMLDWVILTVVL